jgi:hypothetical protein
MMAMTCTHRAQRHLGGIMSDEAKPTRRPGSRGPLPGQGAGGRPPKEDEDRKLKTGISMLPSSWRALDDLKGTTSRGDFVAALIAQEKARRK